MTTGPYGTAAATYWEAGWRSPIPLPPKAKKNPPAGFTGEAGIYPSYADIDAWATGPEGIGNIALRMPVHIIGIDVDAYGDKPGAETVALAEAAHGPLPATWRTTSRDDGISGIRFYRVPEGLAWPGEIGGGTEIIQARHRYALVWPSLHPPEGKTYRWIGPDGVISTGVPDPDDLPALPDAWVQAYTGGILSAATPRVDVEHSAAVAWIAGRDHATADMCKRMEKALDQFNDALRGSAHNSARDAALRIPRLADEGHHGAVHALAYVRKAFLADATKPERSILSKNQRTHAEAVHEFGELVASGVGVVLANPTGMATCDCHGQLTNLISPHTTDGTAALAPLTQPEHAVAETSPDPEPDGLKRLKDGAAFILDAPDTLPNLWGEGDDSLWAKGEALMICGPPGVGKTTLTGQLVRGLLGLQRSVLGLPVAQAEGRVLYLAMDRPAQIARGFRRVFHESERALLKDRLRFWEGPPPSDVARHPDVLLSLATLAEADIVIIDSLKDAAVGLTEDEVASSYNRARQMCLANHIQVLELHHMVKRGQGGNKPTELADVYGSAWLTAGCGSVVLLWGAAGDPIVDMRHLKQPAGEVGPWRLQHDHDTGETTIFHSTDLLVAVAAAGPSGLSAKGAAALVEETDKPTRNAVEKVRRRLEKLVGQGLVDREEATPDIWTGGKPETVYRLCQEQSRSNHAASSETTNHDQTTAITDADDSGVNSNHASNHGNHAEGAINSAPPLVKGGARDRVENGHALVTAVACKHCFTDTPKVTADTFSGLCGNCAQKAGLLT